MCGGHYLPSALTSTPDPTPVTLFTTRMACLGSPPRMFAVRMTTPRDQRAEDCDNDPEGDGLRMGRRCRAHQV